MIEYRALAPVIPVFTLVAIGFLFAQWKKISLQPLTEVIIFLGTPCLVFTSLATRPIFPRDIVVILAGAAGIIGGVGLLIWIYCHSFRLRSRGFILPVLFMNSGNMGLPLSLFAFGEPGLQRATLFLVTISTLTNSLGVYIVSGSRGWREIFRLPLLYATSLGLFFNYAELSIPDPVFEPIRLLGHSAIPLMLVALGYRLNSLGSITWGHSVAGALIRIVGGVACAYLTVTALGIEGVNRQVILLYGSLPSAVVNFVLTERYGQDPELAASIIVISTSLSLLTIPVVLSLI